MNTRADWVYLQNNLYLRGEIDIDEVKHIREFIAANKHIYQSERLLLIVAAVLLGITSALLSFTRDWYGLIGAITGIVFAAIAAAFAYTSKLSRVVGVSMPSAQNYHIETFGRNYYVTMKKISILRFIDSVPVEYHV